MLRWIAISLLTFSLACGDSGSGPAAIEFSPCGGEIAGEWAFDAASLASDIDACGSSVTISGLLIFNTTGRYSVNANVTGWKRAPGDTCTFTTAEGGFFRATDSDLCIADTSEAANAGTCRVSAEYCVDLDALKLPTANMLGLRTTAVLALTRMR